MSDNIEMGNPETTSINTDQVQQNIHGAAWQVAKDVNNGKTPSLTGGNDAYSLMAEAGVSRKGDALGIAMSAYGEMNNASGPSTGARKPKSKKERKMEALASPYGAMGMGKSYSQKKSDAKKLRKILAGKGKDKDPMSGSTGKDFSGNTIKKKKRVFVTPDMLIKTGMHSTRKLKINNDAAAKEKIAPAVGGVVDGAQKNHQDKTSQIKQVNPEEIVGRTTSMNNASRRKLLEQILDEKQTTKALLTPEEKDTAEKLLTPEYLKKENEKDRRISLGKKKQIHLGKSPQIMLHKPPMPN